MSSPTKKSENNSKRSPSSGVDVSKFNADGHDFIVARTLLGKRAEQRVFSLADLAQVPVENIIKTEDLVPPAFQKPEPPVVGAEPSPEIAGDLSAEVVAEAHRAWTVNKEIHEKWEADKAEFEKLHPVPVDQKIVTLWAPVFHITKVLMDGMPLRIFHTARAIIMGAVRNEDSNRVMLYSPCILDPNVERNRIHYFPMAFVGLDFILYKPTCIGESIPQVAEISGYPAFVNANHQGDYQFRGRGAYHHIEADLPADAPVHSVSQDVRAHNAGLVPTSDTREGPAINKARAINAMVKQPSP